MAITEPTLSKLIKELAKRAPNSPLPGSFYHDPSIFEFESSRLIPDSWYLVCHVEELAKPGDYRIHEIADESVILVRSSAHNLRAWLNVCRHRGSRMIDAGRGTCAIITCPYHGWQYSTEGDLISPRIATGGNLMECKVEVVNGLVFVGLRQPPSLTTVKSDLNRFLYFHGLYEAKLAGVKRWTVRANWKLLVENFAECYHCKINHPEYSAVMQHTDSEAGYRPLADSDKDFCFEWETQVRTTTGHLPEPVLPDPDRLHACARFPLRPGCLSQTMNGRLLAPLMGNFLASDGGVTSVRIYPSSYVIASCDHAVTLTFVPMTAETTEIQVQWLVRADAAPGKDVDVDELMKLWFLTCEQDNALVERQQLGVKSMGYDPIGYGPNEEYCEVFIQWYTKQLTALI